VSEARLSGPIASLDAPIGVAPAPAPRRWYLRFDQWVLVLGIAGAAAFMTISFYEKDSWWIGFGIFVTIAVLMHTFMIARDVPWIPGMVAAVALIQWVIAPWAAYYVPPDASVFDMVLRPNEYFAYAVPATILFTVGLYLPMWRVGRYTRDKRPFNEPTTFRSTCDVMIGIGTVAFLVLPSMPMAYHYSVELLTYLAFVGAYGLMLVDRKGWGWRLLFVLGIRMAISTGSGLFHEFMLWLAYSAALFIYARRVRLRTVLLILAVGGFFVGVLDEAKLAFRKAIAVAPDMTVGQRFAQLGEAVVDQAQQPVETFTGPALSHFVTRLNQGWIIARVMYWVPSNEPYANGETIVNAFRIAFVPRILDPGKYEAGGVEYFERFTGFRLYNNTSMNLSVAGEMYANFGALGGFAGVFLFGFGLGMIYRLFAQAAQKSVLWWAWAPYVLLYAMMAENGIGEGVNQFAKSFLVMIAVVTFVPAWQNLVRRHTA
jgi:hypothetical protein